MSSAGIASIVERLLAGTTTVVALIEDHVERAAASQPALNAFTMIDAERALSRAEVIDERRAAGDTIGPLAGVPVAVKDLIDHAGRPNTRGGSFPAPIPSMTAPCVERLEAAGAVIIGRTGLHEFAFGFSSENHWHGAVHNPWDTDLSPGGSSGGSAAAVAAGVVPAAIGTDTGGSIRVPAALCGVVGLKVTHGRVPIAGVFPLAPSLDTVGPIARTVADVAALYQVIAGDDPLDAWSSARDVDPVGERRLVGLRIGVPRPWVDDPLDPVVAAGFSGALDALRNEGAEVFDLDIPQLSPPGMIEASVYFEVASIHRRMWAAKPDGYGPSVRPRLERAFAITGDEYLAALEWRAATRAAAERAFRRCDVLVTPTVGALRKMIGIDEVEIEGERFHYRTPLSRFTALVNHVGLPALAVPLAAEAIPPPSMQLIGPAWSEADLLAVATAMEAAGIVGYATPPQWFD